jgi:NAD(P)-dependent dehydrogenase (short-subunit alcohol dehydrogenase family)
LNLEGKTILVTGASSGIGRAIAILLSSYGADVIVTGRNKENLSETLGKLTTSGSFAVEADLTAEMDVANLVGSIQHVDGVVFCAGIVEYLPVKFLTREKIDKTFNLNFVSQVLLTQALLKQKKVNNNSSLIYISSIAGKLGVAGTAMYASSKAALSGFVRVLAVELAGRKIRVNALSPGIVRTPMTSNSELAFTKEDLDNDEKKYPLGYGDVKDVANYAAFLLSDVSPWITGTDLILDGGFTLN